MPTSMRPFSACAIVLSTLLFAQVAMAQLFPPAQLTCDRTANPLGIDKPKPTLAWVCASRQRGAVQTAYQILVASSADLLAKNKGDLWDSGQVKAGSTTQVDYDGAELHSAQQVFWKVRTWNEKDVASEWSDPAQWTMGLLHEADWNAAKWIGIDVKIQHSIGYHAAIAKKGDDVKWVQVDLGKAQPITSVRLQPMVHVDKPGFAFPLRFKVEASDDPKFQTATVITNQPSDFKNPGDTIVPFDCAVSARYVRVTASKIIEERPGEFCFALRRIEVISQGKNIAANKPVTAKDSVEQFGWGKAGFTDEPSTADPAFTPNGTTQLMREFTVKPQLKRALLFACGLGEQFITVDGKKITDDFIGPGYSDYRKTCFYTTYDITAPLGSNASHRLDLLLGNGFYNLVAAPGRYVKFTGSYGPRKAIALVRLEYTDGSVENVITDDRWKAAPGATTFANLYAGEDYDARIDADAGRTAWISATVLPEPGGKLTGTSNAAPPVREDIVFKAAKITQRKAGISVYDFGQNATMIPHLVVTGPAGSTVRMTPAEAINADGSLNRKTSTQDGERPAWWEYTLAGAGEETFVPKFFWHCSRYVQVELKPATTGNELPTIKSLESHAIMSLSPAAGEFACSNELFNKAFSLVRWAQRNNMGSMLTDCPHRERWGWLEEAHLNGPSLRYNFNMSALFNKIMGDMTDDQDPDGLVPNFVPEFMRLGGAFTDSSEWGSSIILVAWQQYEFYGDRDVLVRSYEPMKRYLNYLRKKSKDNIVGGGLGDWFDIGPKAPWEPQLTPKENTDTCFYFRDAQVMAQVAALLGKQEDASEFTQLAADIRSSFNRKFFNPDTNQYSTGSQASNAIPYAMGIVEPEHRAAVFENVLADLKKHGNSFTTGEVAYRYLLRTLADAGRSDVVFTINNQTDKPGYGMQIKKGLTSLSERWDGEPTIWASQSHFMSGQIIEWFYHDLAGIQQAPDSSAFDKIIIKPAIVGDITWVKAKYDSVKGPIASEWKRNGTSLSLHAVIPCSATATIAVPATDADSVREGGQSAGQSAGVKFIKMGGGYALFAVGAGEYSFESTLPPAASGSAE